MATKASNHSNEVLKIICKAIVKQIRPEDAERLNESYRAGKTIGFRIRENSRGKGYMTAFQPFVDETAIDAKNDAAKEDDPRNEARFHVKMVMGMQHVY